MRALHISAAPFLFAPDSIALLRDRSSPWRCVALGSGVRLGFTMPSLLRFVLAAIAALLIAVPAGAVQPKGSAAWTTDGWVSLSGTLYAGPGPRYDDVGTVGLYERVRVDRCSRRWCEIHTSSVHGWISLDNLSFGQQPDGLFAGPKFHTERGGSGSVCFYDGAEFTGSSFCAKSGRVINDLALLGIDNSIASIEVGDDVSAVVCRDRGFRSYCEVVDVSKGRLDGLLTNGISSIRVY
jgi:uncharacterized protein YraI